MVKHWLQNWIAHSSPCVAGGIACDAIQPSFIYLESRATGAAFSEHILISTLQGVKTFLPRILKSVTLLGQDNTLCPALKGMETSKHRLQNWFAYKNRCSGEYNLVIRLNYHW